MPGPHHRSLRESFRKLVRPLVKLRGDNTTESEEGGNSTDDEAGSVWQGFSRRSSRRDSRQSASGGGRHHTPEQATSKLNSRLMLADQPEGSLAEEEAGASADESERGSVAPESKWRKI